MDGAILWCNPSACVKYAMVKTQFAMLDEGEIQDIYAPVHMGHM